MIFLKYKQPQAEYVQFQRLALGLIILGSVLFENIELIQLFTFLSAVSFITTMNYSPTTFLFRLLSFLFAKPFFTTAPQYAHSYITNRLAEIFEDLMRIGGGLMIIYIYSFSMMGAWMMASFMGIAMMISSFFGFCLSSLMYIGYKKLVKIFGS
ncbi:MAG: hypothetical protein COA44_06730 [Arcobacter sp.]|nr:MAG: hypothetical protein COA44_06730 [Arcobacter sp.]